MGGLGWRWLGGVVCLFGLAACGGVPAGRSCPPATIIDDLAQFGEFANPARPNLLQLTRAARLEAVAIDCDYASDKTVANLDITFRAYHGPAKTSADGALPYFVSVVRNNQIISKQALQTVFELGTAENVAEHTEKLRLNLPYDEKAAAEAVHVLVGFQLSPDQLAFNRGDTGEPKALSSPRAPVAHTAAP